MRFRFAGVGAVALGCALSIGAGHAQAPAATQGSAPASAAPVEVLHIRGPLYMISGAGGNIVVSVGLDGVYVVDTGLRQNADRVLAAIEKIQRDVQAMQKQPRTDWGVETVGTLQDDLSYVTPIKPIRFIVNTHVHPDHVGGNERLRKAGRTFTGGNVAGDLGSDAGDDAMVFAHENVLVRLSPPDNPQQVAANETTLPSDTYFGDQMKFSQFFNGDGIQFFHPKNAHTDGDTMVFFRGTDVLVTGDLFTMTTYPIIDLDKGGHINGIIAAANQMLDLAVPEFRLEGGTMIVPGHGRLSDSADLAYYRDMLTIIRDRIQNMVDKGMSLDQVKASHPTEDYDPRYGATSGFWTTDQFVTAVYRNLSADRQQRRGRR